MHAVAFLRHQRKCFQRARGVGLDGPFNLENSATAGGYFLGDYEGMTAVGTSFKPFFAAPTATDPDNTYLATITP